MEQRICVCGAVQTEQHVLLLCPVSEPIRGLFQDLNFMNLGTLMGGSAEELALYCFKVLERFESDQMSDVAMSEMQSST